MEATAHHLYESDISVEQQENGQLVHGQILCSDVCANSNTGNSESALRTDRKSLVLESTRTWGRAVTRSNFVRCGTLALEIVG